MATACLAIGAVLVSVTCTLLLAGCASTQRPATAVPSSPVPTAGGPASSLGELAASGSASGTATTAVLHGMAWRIVRDEVVAAPYYWVVDGERVDRWPQISPDGSKVVYLPTVDGKATDFDRLVVRDLATGIDRDLTPETGCINTSARWSPDGNSIAFVKYCRKLGVALPCELWRIDADGADPKLLHRVYSVAPGMRGPALGIHRWSADGSYLETGWTIWSGGGAEKRIRTDGTGDEDAVYPTPSDYGVGDGALVAGRSLSPAGDYTLQVVRTSGLLQKPKGAPEIGYSLVLYDLQANRSMVLGSFPGLLYLSRSSISPDGEWIVFQVVPLSSSGLPDGPARLWVVRRDGTVLREITTEPYELVQDGGLLWSDGGRAYFNGLPGNARNQVEGHLYELDAASGVARLVTADCRMHDLVSVSRDGRRLLVVRGGWDKAELHLLELSP